MYNFFFRFFGMSKLPVKEIKKTDRKELKFALSCFS